MLQTSYDIDPRREGGVGDDVKQAQAHTLGGWSKLQQVSSNNITFLLAF